MGNYAIETVDAVKVNSQIYDIYSTVYHVFADIETSLLLTVCGILFILCETVGLSIKLRHKKSDTQAKDYRHLIITI